MATRIECFGAAPDYVKEAAEDFQRHPRLQSLAGSFWNTFLVILPTGFDLLA